MAGFSVVSWAILLIALSTIIPAAMVLKRAGLSRWWTVLYVIPLINWVALWVFAYARWPAVEPGVRAPAPNA